MSTQDAARGRGKHNLVYETWGALGRCFEQEQLWSSVGERGDTVSKKRDERVLRNFGYTSVTLIFARQMEPALAGT